MAQLALGCTIFPRPPLPPLPFGLGRGACSPNPDWKQVPGQAGGQTLPAASVLGEEWPPVWWGAGGGAHHPGWWLRRAWPGGPAPLPRPQAGALTRPGVGDSCQETRGFHLNQTLSSFLTTPPPPPPPAAPGLSPRSIRALPWPSRRSPVGNGLRQGDLDGKRRAQVSQKLWTEGGAEGGRGFASSFTHLVPQAQCLSLLTAPLTIVQSDILATQQPQTSI